MEAEQDRLYRGRIALMQQQVGRAIGTYSDLDARLFRMQLHASPPHSRASGSPPSPSASPPLGSREVSSWGSVISPGNLRFPKFHNIIHMWKPPPPGPPASSGQIRRSVSEQLDIRTLNSQMKLSGLSQMALPRKNNRLTCLREHRHPFS